MPFSHGRRTLSPISSTHNQTLRTSRPSRTSIDGSSSGSSRSSSNSMVSGSNSMTSGSHNDRRASALSSRSSTLHAAASILGSDTVPLAACGEQETTALLLGHTRDAAAAATPTRHARASPGNLWDLVKSGLRADEGADDCCFSARGGKGKGEGESADSSGRADTPSSSQRRRRGRGFCYLAAAAPAATALSAPRRIRDLSEVSPEMDQLRAALRGSWEALLRARRAAAEAGADAEAVPQTRTATARAQTVQLTSLKRSGAIRGRKSRLGLRPRGPGGEGLARNRADNDGDDDGGGDGTVVSAARGLGACDDELNTTTAGTSDGESGGSTCSNGSSASNSDTARRTAPAPQPDGDDVFGLRDAQDESPRRLLQTAKWVRFAPAVEVIVEEKQEACEQACCGQGVRRSRTFTTRCLNDEEEVGGGGSGSGDDDDDASMEVLASESESDELEGDDGME